MRRFFFLNEFRSLPLHTLCLSLPLPPNPVKVFDCPCGATLTCSFKMMCSSQVCSQHSFVPQRGPPDWPVRRPHTDRRALGALKPTTHDRVKRQLSVIVNVDTAPQWQNQWSYRWHQSQQHKILSLVSPPPPLWLNAWQEGRKEGRKKKERKKERSNSDLYWPFFQPSQRGYAVLWRLCALDRQPKWPAILIHLKQAEVFR